MLVWVILGVALVLLLAGVVIRRRQRPKLDTTIRVGGYTVAQVKAIRRDIFAGRLPNDGSLHEVALALSRQAANNLPLELSYLAPYFAAIALLFVGIGVSSALPPAAGLTGAVVVAGYGAYIVIAGLRGARNCRRLLAAAEAPPAQ